MTMLLVVIGSLGLCGVLVVFLVPKIKAHIAYRKAERERIENIRLEEERIASEERKLYATIEAKREEQERLEAVRVRQEEDAQIRAYTRNYLLQKVASVVTDPEYVQHQRDAERAERDMSDVTGEITRLEARLIIPQHQEWIAKLALFVGSLCFFICLYISVTVAESWNDTPQNTILAMLGQLLNLGVVLVGLEIASAVIMPILRMAYDKWREAKESPELQVQQQRRSSTLCLVSIGALCLIVLSFFSQYRLAGDYADTQYNGQINNKVFELTQKESAEDPSEDEIALLKQTIENLKAKRDGWKEFYQSIAVITEVCEDICGFLALDAYTIHVLKKNRATRERHLRAQDAAVDAQHQMQAIARSQVIERVPLDMSTPQLLAQLGVEIQIDPPADDDDGFAGYLPQGRGPQASGGGDMGQTLQQPPDSSPYPVQYPYSSLPSEIGASLGGTDMGQEWQQPSAYLPNPYAPPYSNGASPSVIGVPLGGTNIGQAWQPPDLPSNYSLYN